MRIGTRSTGTQLLERTRRDLLEVSDGQISCEPHERGLLRTSGFPEKLPVPIHTCAIALRLRMQVRDTRYSMPSLVYSRYSPPAAFRISRMHALLTKTDLWMRTNPRGSRSLAIAEMEPLPRIEPICRCNIT